MYIDPKWELEAEIIMAKVQKEGPESLTEEEKYVAKQVLKMLMSLPPEVARARFGGRSKPFH